MSTFMTFQEWKAANPDIELEDCEDCGGDGEDECPHCGRWGRCETCHGSGKKRTLEQLYREQRDADEAKLAARFGLIRSGVTP